MNAMKLEIWSDSGANIHSENTAVVSLAELGFSDEEWLELSWEEKDKAVRNYCWETEMLSYGFSEVPS